MRGVILLSKNLAFWIGLTLALVGALSQFLPFLASGFGIVWGDPRRAGSILILAGLALSGIGLWSQVRHLQSQYPRRGKTIVFILVLILSGLYFTRMFIAPPYSWEAVHFSNGEVELAGTLLVPHNNGPHPAVILMRGCCSVGDESRWGSFALADMFARHGIASLFYDKRGYGDSTGDSSAEATFQELADDTLAGLDYLLTQPNIDAEQIGLFGISNSSLIAPLAAWRSNDVAFLIVVSGGGYTAADEFVFDQRIALEDAGFSQPDIAHTIPRAIALREQINDYYRTGRGYDEVITTLQQVEEEAWFKATNIPGPDEVCLHGSRCAMNHITNWDFDPVPLLVELDIPMLFLYGPNDRIVPATQSANRLRETLVDKANRDAEIVMIQGAGHTMLEAWPVISPSCDCKPITLEGDSLLGVMIGFMPRYIPEFQNAMITWLSEHVRVAYP